MKNMLGFLTFAGASILVAGVVSSVEAAIAQSSHFSEIAAQTIQLSQTTDLASEATKTQLTPQADGTITGELTFTGNANEIVVIHIPERAALIRYTQDLKLFNSAGEEVRIQFGYPNYRPFDQNRRGTYRTVLLPETGTYRLTFEGTLRDIDDASGDDYPMLVRDATYYERLLIAAEDAFESDREEEAFDLWAAAIADSPDNPSAYMYRVFARAEQVYDSPEFSEKLQAVLPEDHDDLEKIEQTLFPLIHETFLELPATEQTSIISDLRQLNRLVSEAIANGELDPNEEGIAYTWFSGIADFLETGVPSDALRQIFFGTAQATAEPVIVSPESPALGSPEEPLLDVAPQE